VRSLKFPIVIAAFVAVLLLGVAARQVYVKSRVVDPLARVAEEVRGVKGVRVEERSGLKDVVVALGPDAYLEEAYGEVERTARSVLGRSFGRIRLEDRRSPRLEEAFYSVHFFVHEGISTGRFAEMASRFDERLSELGIARRRVFVADRHVFVQLYDGEHYLYEVVPRVSEGGFEGRAAGGRSA